MSSTFLCVKWLFLSRMYRFVSLGCFGNERPKQCQHTGKKKKVSSALCREMGRERIFFFRLRFSHWVTQFHAPLAYLGWRTMKSVQFWDFRGTVFWNLLRYVAILLSPPLDRLHYYVTVAKVKLWWWYVPFADKLLSNSTLNGDYWAKSQMIQQKASIHFVTYTFIFYSPHWKLRADK